MNRRPAEDKRDDDNDEMKWKSRQIKLSRPELYLRIRQF